MNWDQIKGTWKQLEGKAKEKWGRLTDDDLDVIQGRRDQLVGKLQERYGYEKEQAEKAGEECAKGKKSRGIGGLIGESREIMDKTDHIEKDAMDGALIAAAQRIEHYEISAYGTLGTYARLLSGKRVTKPLEETLTEESKANKKLSRIEVKRVNPKILSS